MDFETIVFNLNLQIQQRFTNSKKKKRQVCPLKWGQIRKIVKSLTIKWRKFPHSFTQPIRISSCTRLPRAKFTSKAKYIVLEQNHSQEQQQTRWKIGLKKKISSKNRNATVSRKF